LHTSPWRLGQRVRVNNFVNHYCTSFKSFGYALSAFEIAGKNRSSQTVDRIIRKSDSFFVSLKRHDRKNWTKRLFSHYRHRMIDVCDDRGLIKPAVVFIATSATNENPCSSIKRIFNMLLDRLE